jgi:hypothetical protein
MYTFVSTRLKSEIYFLFKIVQQIKIGSMIDLFRFQPFVYKLEDPDD